MTTPETELLPCPFCGDEAQFEQVGSVALVEGCAWSVGCGNDQCLGFQSVTTYARKAEAAAAWNTRIPIPSDPTTIDNRLSDSALAEDEMVEKVTQAFCDAEGAILKWLEYEDLARIAIKVLSTPTEQEIRDRERERIVAWLRNGANFEGWKQGLTLRHAADAIEQGAVE